MVGRGTLYYITSPAYPAPDVGNVLILWGGMVVSATVLLSSVSFALGTLLPRQSSLVKIGILLAWFVGTFMLPRLLSDTTSPPAWYSAWDPTSAVTTQRMLLQYSADFQHQTTHLASCAQLQHAILPVEDQLPNLRT